MSKNILITGITGFVGSHLADYIIKNEPNSKIFGARRLNSRMRNVAHISNNVKWIDADVNDPTSMRSLIEKTKPDEIYHLAALSWVTPSWDMPSAYMQTNAIGTINLFEAMRSLDCKAKVLVSCTPEEFGDVPEEKLPITEETEIHPINPYAASKVAQDMVCLTWAASYDFQIIRTRAFNHEGPRRDINGANASFAYQIASIEAGKQEPIIKVGNLDATRNFTDVRDTSMAYALAMEHCKPNELYLIGSDFVYTMKECLEYLISQSTNKNIKYEIDPERVRPTELRNFVVDFSKFHKATGWKPTVGFEETMDGVLEYWRNFVEKDLY